MALLETARLFISEKKSAYMVIGDKYFQIFGQFSVLKPYFYKNMYFLSFEFMNLSTGLLLHVYLASD